jgi:predicted N-acetyltransferase YhbS
MTQLSNAVIRTYIEGDEDEIAKALNECFESFKSFELTGEKWLKTFEYDLGYKKDLAFVAEKDGRIVSHVQLVERDLKVGAGASLRVVGVANVATVKECRRSGISTRLLTHALDVARKKGFHASALFTGTKIPAHRIYMRLGFSDVYPALLLFRDLKSSLVWDSNEEKGGFGRQRVEVRESNESDDPSLLDIYEKNYGSYNGLAVRDKETWKRKFRNLFVYECPFYEDESKPDNVLVAEREGEGIIGYAMSCIAKRDKFGHICEILTLPDYEREAGRALAEHLLSNMRELKPLTIMIYSSENTLNDQLFRKGSTPLTGTSVFMFRIISLKETMESALCECPEAKKKRAHQISRAIRGSITIRIAGEQSATVRLDEGLSVTEGEENSDVVTFVDHESFARLLFGAKRFTELLNEGRIRLSLVDAKGSQVVSLLEDFFPKKPTMTFPADFW